MTQNHLAISGINILAMSILSYMVYCNFLFDPKTRRHFLYAVLSIAVVIIAEMGTVFPAYPMGSAQFLQNGFNVIGFSVSPFVPIMVASTFGNRFRIRGILFSLPAVINLIFTLLSPAFGFIFRVLPDSSYFRGPWFFMYIIAYIAGIVFLFVETLSAIKIYQNRNKPVLLWLFLLFLLGTVIQLLFPSVHTTWPSVSLVMIMYYTYYCDLLEKHDVLTNLMNRRSYEYHLPRLGAKGSGSVTMLDVDDFKLINDKYGHQFGDECLRVIAGNIRATFGKIGSCYRIGGDEFCVLSQAADENALMAAEAAFARRMDIDRGQNRRLPCVSFGSAFCNDTQKGINQTVAEADSLMFLHKQQHKQEKKKGDSPDSSFKSEVPS